jgi:predicted Rossmann fold flavoprotein
LSTADTARRQIVVVGAGAAGLATAIFARRLGTAPVQLLDGAARPGAKILVSGGSRCNVTNTVVTERDYWGGRRTIIRRVLSRLPVDRTIEFFAEIGIPLKVEPTGKLFPRSDRSRDVLDALLGAARETGVELRPGTRVEQVRKMGDTFTLQTSRGPLQADAVVLATGGLSLPKTGSDGAGLGFARDLGHSIVPTTPALAPLVLHGGFNAGISGVALDVELSLWTGGRVRERIRGPMLWTHFGISGPAALDLSRHWLRAQLEGARPEVSASVLPAATFESADAFWTTTARQQPRARVQAMLATQVPASLASTLVSYAGLDPDQPLADLTRDGRRTLVRALTALPLPVVDSRGYNYAEATAGGVALDEIDPVSMQSRRCAGLYLVGEMLDVDGRLGGFNFQWAWASGRTAAEGLARTMPS